MKGHFTPIFWIEAMLAGASALFLVLTLFWEEWIEIIFGASPDGGNGSLEWTIAIACVLCTAVFSVLARNEWRWTMRAH